MQNFIQQTYRTLSTGNTQLFVLHYIADVIHSETSNEIRYQSHAVTLPGKTLQTDRATSDLSHMLNVQKRKKKLEAKLSHNVTSFTHLSSPLHKL